MFYFRGFLLSDLPHPGYEQYDHRCRALGAAHRRVAVLAVAPSPVIADRMQLSRYVHWRWTARRADGIMYLPQL